MLWVAAGKTTFIKNLFASYTQDPNLKVNDVPGSTSKDTFVQHPDKLLTEIVVKDERNMLAYHYRVQDTPGRSIHRCTVDAQLLICTHLYLLFLTSSYAIHTRWSLTLHAMI